MRKDLDREGVRAICPVCEEVFRCQYTHFYKMKNTNRIPTCSRECDMEQRYGESRDKKWSKDQAKILRKLTRESDD